MRLRKYQPMLMKQHLANRRNGATLVEVLVAIAVMGVGLLALLTLFPIGILTMQQAILDDRTAHAVKNAVAQAQALRIREDTQIMNALDNSTGNPAMAASANGPSYPVYVDSIGFFNSGGTSLWVGGQTNGIARKNLSFVTSTQQSLRWFTLLDDIVFDDSGLPQYLNPGDPTSGFDRLGDFSWAYLLRRPLNGVPAIVSMTAVVYYKRPLVSTGSVGELQYAAIFNPTTNLITVASSSAPEVRVGQWILDSTPVTNSTCHAKFYRVVGITDNGTSIDLEVQSPIMDFPVPGANPYNGTIIVMDGVAEVFEVGAGWRVEGP